MWWRFNWKITKSALSSALKMYLLVFSFFDFVGILFFTLLSPCCPKHTQSLNFIHFICFIYLFSKISNTPKYYKTWPHPLPHTPSMWILIHPTFPLQSGHLLHKLRPFQGFLYVTQLCVTFPPHTVSPIVEPGCGRSPLL